MLMVIVLFNGLNKSDHMTLLQLEVFQIVQSLIITKFYQLLYPLHRHLFRIMDLTLLSMKHRQTFSALD